MAHSGAHHSITPAHRGLATASRTCRCCHCQVFPSNNADWCAVGNLQVEEIALNMTVLKRWDGSRIWYPNSLVNVVPILNLTRSENKWEFFKVSHHTCLQSLVLLGFDMHPKLTCYENQRQFDRGRER